MSNVGERPEPNTTLDLARDSLRVGDVAAATELLTSTLETSGDTLTLEQDYLLNLCDLLAGLPVDAREGFEALVVDAATALNTSPDAKSESTLRAGVGLALAALAETLSGDPERQSERLHSIEEMLTGMLNELFVAPEEVARQVGPSIKAALGLVKSYSPDATSRYKGLNDLADARELCGLDRPELYIAVTIAHVARLIGTAPLGIPPNTRNDILASIGNCEILLEQHDPQGNWRYARAMLAQLDAALVHQTEFNPQVVAVADARAEHALQQVDESVRSAIAAYSQILTQRSLAKPAR